jgi:glycosyltransferase involved in cell wall biosynthesis
VKSISILLTTDGTYPCYGGGVSVWCDQLIRSFASSRFHVLAVVSSPSHAPIFARPENVVSQQLLALWGTEEPGVVDGDFVTTLLHKARTTSGVIQSRFQDPFEQCLNAILRPATSPESLAEALVALHSYFREFDYARSMSSPEAWEAFLRVATNSMPSDNRFTIAEAMTCMRWMQRFLQIVAMRIPEVDLVHASMAGLAGIPGVLHKKLNKTPFLLTEHGIYLRELYLSLEKMQESEHCRRFLFSWFEAVARMNYHYADAVSALCEFNQKWQIRVGAAPEKIQIIPNGIDASKFFPADSEPESANEPPVVLTLARIYPLKGIDVLMRTARLVLDEMPEVRFRILGEVGDEEYHRECLRMADELQISGNIDWGVTRDPAPAYRTATVFCLPSISEGMPFSILEAMFSGCPVVATQVGGVADMLGGTGLVVTPRDSASMASALLSLLKGSGAAEYRRELAGKALSRAHALFTLDKTMSNFRSQYEHLTQEPAATSKLRDSY